MANRGRPRLLASRALRLLGVYGACLAGAAVVSWPLVRHVRGHLPGAWPHPDIHTAVWFRWHLWERLGAGEAPMFAPGFYHPDGMDVTLHIWNLGVALGQLPFVAVLGSLTGYNVSLLFLGAFNGLAGYVLGRTVGAGRRAPAIAAAAVLLTSNFAWAEMIHGRAEQGLLAFAALYAAGLVSLRRDGGQWTAVGTGLALAAAGLCYWFYAAFLGIPLIGLALASGIRRRPDVQALGRLAIVAGVAAVLLIPAAIPVLTRMAADDSAYLRAVADTSEVATLVEGLRQQFSLSLLGSTLWPTAALPQRVCLGLPFLLLAVLGAALCWGDARRRAGYLPWLALVGILMAMGPMLQLRPEEALVVQGRVLPLPSALLDRLPLFERMWWPHRWLSLAVVGGAGCAAALAAAIPPGRRARWLSLAFALLLLVEVRAMYHGAPYTALAGNPQPLPVPAMLKQLATEPGRHPLLQLPLRRVDDAAAIYVPIHRQPIDGGPAYSADLHTEPGYLRRIAGSEALTALDRMARGQPPPQVREPRGQLRELGFHYAVFWRDQDVFGLDWSTLYSDFLGTPPVFADDTVVVWDLAR